MHRSVLVAFDFDHTIADNNTDIVARKLLPKEKLPDSVKDLYRSNGWITYMRKIFELLHSNSIGVEEIKTAVAGIPVVPGVETLLRELHSRGCEIIIISDSNTLFIDEWLRSKQLSHVVAETFTNPAVIDGDGLIKLGMYHVQDSCDLSTVNLCKGQILEDYVKRRAGEGTRFDHIAYVGDGKNDLCPILRLSENDVAFPREEYVLVKILNDTESRGLPKVQARVFPWRDGLQILRTLEKELGLAS